MSDCKQEITFNDPDCQQGSHYFIIEKPIPGDWPFISKGGDIAVGKMVRLEDQQVLDGHTIDAVDGARLSAYGRCSIFSFAPSHEGGYILPFDCLRCLSLEESVKFIADKAWERDHDTCIEHGLYSPQDVYAYQYPQAAELFDSFEKTPFDNNLANTAALLAMTEEEKMFRALKAMFDGMIGSYDDDE